MKNLINFTSWAPFAVVLFWFTAIPFPGFWASGPVYPLIAYGMLVMAVSLGGHYLTDYTPKGGDIRQTVFGFMLVFVPAVVFAQEKVMAPYVALFTGLLLAAVAAVAGWMMYISGRKRYEISKRQWYKQAIRDKVQHTDCLQSYSANVADWTDDRHETAALEDRYNNLCKLARASQDTLTARSKLQA